MRSSAAIMSFDHLIDKTRIFCERLNSDCALHCTPKDHSGVGRQPPLRKNECALEALMHADEMCVQCDKAVKPMTCRQADWTIMFAAFACRMAAGSTREPIQSGPVTAAAMGSA